MDFLGVMSLGLATALTAAVALLCWTLLRTGRPALDATLLVFLWVFIVTFDLLVLGLAGVMTRSAIAISSALGLVGLSLIPRARHAVRESFTEIRSWARPLRAGWGGLPRWLRGVTIVALPLWCLRLAFLMWALPPFVWDSLTYHLTNVAHWIQTGRIEVFVTPVLRIYSPANYEVFASWFAVFFHHDGLIEASGLPAYLIVVLAVYATAKRLKVSRTAAWIAGLGVASTPALVLAVTGTKNDPIMAAIFLSMVAVVVDMSLDVAEGLDRPMSPRLLALALLFLYGFGTKPYMLHLIPGVLVMGALLAGGRHRLAYLRRFPEKARSELRGRPKAAYLLALGLLASGLVLGSYWYARNEVLQGNPFYPYGVTLAGAQVEGGPGASFHLDLPTLWENLQLTAGKFGDKQSRITPDLPNTTGWGWVAYGMGIPALLWALVRKPTFRALGLGFLVSGLTLLLSSPTSPWNMRYMVWAPALLCLALGAAYDGVIRSPRSTSAFALLFVACLALNFTTTLNYNLVKTDQLKSMLARPFWDRQTAYLDVHVPYEYENALVNVPAEAILGYNVHANGFVYPLFRADFSQRLAYIPIQPDQSCGDIARTMQAAGTRYLVSAPEHTDDAVLALLHDCGEKGTVLRELGVGLYVLRQGS